MRQKNHLEQYLQRYAESETEILPAVSPVKSKTHALVIPAFKENPAFIERFCAHPNSRDTLLILVVNEPESSISCAYNTELLQYIDRRFTCISRHSYLSWHAATDLTLLLVNRTGKYAIPEKQGVGLARKIGVDLACSAIEKGWINNRIVFCSDADAHLPNHYFFNSAAKNISAWIFEFEHSANDTELLAATRIYENCIRYYRDQLEAAGSPYAFHALGSCLAIDINAYAQVRGFPKRAAGEDFYLLNKLSKIGKIERRSESRITIDARISDRVPFGTGPSVSKIMAQRHSKLTAKYYNRRIFSELKSVLNNAENFFYEEETISDISKRALDAARFEHFRHSRQIRDKNKVQFAEQFHLWFDAFQTLKFVRRLRTYLPDEDVDLLFDTSNETINTFMGPAS
jgi:hypothetical protein